MRPLGAFSSNCGKQGPYVAGKGGGFEEPQPEEPWVQPALLRALSQDGW